MVTMFLFTVYESVTLLLLWRGWISITGSLRDIFSPLIIRVGKTWLTYLLVKRSTVWGERPVYTVVEALIRTHVNCNVFRARWSLLRRMHLPFDVICLHHPLLSYYINWDYIYGSLLPDIILNVFLVLWFFVFSAALFFFYVLIQGLLCIDLECPAA